MFYLKDPGKDRSVTLTVMWVGIGVAMIKLLLSGSKILGMEFGAFSGVDAAAVVAPFLALYGHKRQVYAKKKSTEGPSDSGAQQ